MNINKVKFIFNIISVTNFSLYISYFILSIINWFELINEFTFIILLPILFFINLMIGLFYFKIDKIKNLIVISILSIIFLIKFYKISDYLSFLELKFCTDYNINFLFLCKKQEQVLIGVLENPILIYSSLSIYILCILILLLLYYFNKITFFMRDKVNEKQT